MFVFAVLQATSRTANAAVAGMVVGLYPELEEALASGDLPTAVAD